MAFYIIYSKENLKPEDSVIIKEGFNWYSLFLGIFWSAYKRIWDLTAIYIIIIWFCIANIKYNWLSTALLETLRVFTSIILAFHANDFYARTLKLRGYRAIDVVYSNSKKNALLRFLDKTA